MSSFVVQLRRMETSQPWGFRLRGGKDQGIALHIEHIQPKGRAAQCGLAEGDRILAICGALTGDMTHGQVKGEILRAGNDLDLTVMRDGSITSKNEVSDRVEEKRVEIDEQPIQKFGGPTFKQVTPKTYQVLEEQLKSGDAATTHYDEAIRPASIFDRKKTDRSEYLKAKGPTIQKAYGENP